MTRLPVVVFYPAAKQDIADILTYLSTEASDSVAERFFDELSEILERLRHHPQIGVLRSYKSPLLQHVRMLPVKDFSKYLVFYLNGKDQICVIRIVHASRDLELLFG